MCVAWMCFACTHVENVISKFHKNFNQEKNGWIKASRADILWCGLTCNKLSNRSKPCARSQSSIVLPGLFWIIYLIINDVSRALHQKISLTFWWNLKDIVRDRFHSKIWYSPPVLQLDLVLKSVKMPDSQLKSFKNSFFQFCLQFGVSFPAQQLFVSIFDNHKCGVLCGPDPKSHMSNAQIQCWKDPFSLIAALQCNHLEAVKRDIFLSSKMPCISQQPSNQPSPTDRRNLSCIQELWIQGCQHDDKWWGWQQDNIQNSSGNVTHSTW